MSKLVSVWGTCDGVDILFKEIGGDEWEAIVPADLTDGQYIVEVWGATQSGFVIYTTAVLYLCDSRCVSLKFINDDVLVKIKMNTYQVIPKSDRIRVEQSSYLFRIWEKFKERVVVKCE